MITKVKSIDITGFVLKTKYNTDKSDLEKKINDAEKKILILVNLLKKAVFNAKITEIESQMPRITSLATTDALTTVINEIPDVSNLVKKKHIMMQKY